jgi:hypothetical protein
MKIGTTITLRFYFYHNPQEAKKFKDPPGVSTAVHLCSQTNFYQEFQTCVSEKLEPE